MYKVLLILDKFFLKYEGGWSQIDPTPPLPPKKNTLKKASLIRVKQKYRKYLKSQKGKNNESDLTRYCVILIFIRLFIILHAFQCFVSWVPTCFTLSANTLSKSTLKTLKQNYESCLKLPEWMTSVVLLISTFQSIVLYL